VLLSALLVGLLWPSLALKYMLYPQLVLKEGSVNYENWKETPIPVYLEIFFFNWTNHENVRNHSIKPHFTEMGPYVFK
jgi:scavenger receptor class B, member 1